MSRPGCAHRMGWDRDDQGRRVCAVLDCRAVLPEPPYLPDCPDCGARPGNAHRLRMSLEELEAVEASALDHRGRP